MHMITRALAAAGLAASLSLAAQESSPLSVNQYEGAFDAPVKQETIDLGQSRFRDEGVRNSLSCYYFPGLLVKEYDGGRQSSEWLSMLRGPEPLPKCELAHRPGERVIEKSEWPGYFKGVKGTLVFFDADDSANGEFLFAVYDSVTGQAVFEDSAYDLAESTFVAKSAPFSRVRVTATKTGYLLHYMRVAYAGCDLHYVGEPCWESVKARLALKGDDVPVCSGYEDQPGPVDSVIAYPVEVTLSPRPAVESVAGVVECWPEVLVQR